jgi:16S rRNA (cytidine1402-2'-O)-methyltransferase
VSTAPAPAEAAAAATHGRGRLLLVPNALDFGAAPQALAAVLPLSVLQHAARLQHWLVEDAKSARAFLKRVHEVVPLQTPLQALAITELPRLPKGAPKGAAKGRAQGGAMGQEIGHVKGHVKEHVKDGGVWPGATSPIEPLLAPALEGQDIGLLSEAGLPGVADPGAVIVAAAHDLRLEVLPLAGPSSLLLALAASGLDGQSFAFVGYLPQEAEARRARIHELEAHSRRARQTQIFIETPYRNAVLFSALLECAAPATRLSVSMALTLPGGFSRTATIARWRAEGHAAVAALSDRLPAVFVLLA